MIIESTTSVNESGHEKRSVTIYTPAFIPKRKNPNLAELDAQDKEYELIKATHERRNRIQQASHEAGAARIVQKVSANSKYTEPSVSVLRNVVTENANRMSETVRNVSTNQDDYKILKIPGKNPIYEVRVRFICPNFMNEEMVSTIFDNLIGLTYCHEVPVYCVNDTELGINDTHEYSKTKACAYTYMCNDEDRTIAISTTDELTYWWLRCHTKKRIILNSADNKKLAETNNPSLLGFNELFIIGNRTWDPAIPRRVNDINTHRAYTEAEVLALCSIEEEYAKQESAVSAASRNFNDLLFRKSYIKSALTRIDATSAKYGKYREELDNIDFLIEEAKSAINIEQEKLKTIKGKINTFHREHLDPAGKPYLNRLETK